MVDIKLILGIASALIAVIYYYPYIGDILRKKTQPHAYTWLVWALTQGTAMIALWLGGGNFAAISLAAGIVLVVTVFFLSLKYGTKNITKSDTVVLILALLAIIVWWQLKNPLLAVFMVSAIDGLGYIPTLRKSFEDPWSETPSFWVAMAISSVLALLANGEYNLLTMTYLATLAIANTTVSIVCIYRRKIISKQ